jgi:hypothetical protein
MIAQMQSTISFYVSHLDLLPFSKSIWASIPPVTSIFLVHGTYGKYIISLVIAEMTRYRRRWCILLSLTQSDNQGAWLPVAWLLLDITRVGRAQCLILSVCLCND